MWIVVQTNVSWRGRIQEIILFLQVLHQIDLAIIYKFLILVFIHFLLYFL